MCDEKFFKVTATVTFELFSDELNIDDEIPNWIYFSDEDCLRNFKVVEWEYE